MREWYPVAQADNTPDSAQGVRRLIELHLLPAVGDERIVDVKAEHVREPVKALIAAGKIATAIALFTYTDAMFTWARRRRPWRVLFDVNPADDVDLDRLPEPYDFHPGTVTGTQCATASHLSPV